MIQGNLATAAVVPLAYQQRRYDRQNLCFSVHFRVLEDDEIVESLFKIHSPARSIQAEELHTGSFETYTHNISDGGLGLGGDLRDLSGRMLEEGDFLKIEIHLPHKTKKIRCLGNVAWVELDEDAEIFRAGVSFIAFNPDDLLSADLR